MKMVKSLVLGSAAGLVALGGAQAADLPVKAKAVEYVRICSLYGAGFYYIPGTDTCIKLGGYLRAQVGLNTSSIYGGAYSTTAGAQNRLTNRYTARSREDLNIDTRTATEYGVVRTFWDATFSWTSGSYGQTAAGTAYVGPGVAGSDTIGVYYAFIQFAGFTMGKAVSQFDTPWQNYPGNNFDGLVGGGGDVTGTNQFSYTADFGQGVSASFSAQDPTVYYTTNIFNTSGALAAGQANGIYGAPSIGGNWAPDFVAKVVVDQAWGLFQANVAAHDNHAAYYGATEITGHPSDKWGWAGQLALSIKNIPTGPGDTVNMQAVYTNGATRYNFQSLIPTSFAMYGGSGVAYQSLGIAGIADTVYGAGTGQSSVTTWGFRGAYTHNWNPYWNTAVYGAYAQLRYGSTGSALVCTAMFATGFLTPGSICNPDFNIGQIGTITRWTPVKNLTFSADVTYTNLGQKFSGFTTTGAPLVAKPGALYELKSQNTVSALITAQRNW
jgi:hypothetical protein